MKLRNLLRPRAVARRVLQRLGIGLRRARLGRAVDLLSPPPPDAYAAWRAHNDVRPYDLAEMKTVIAQLRDRPVFSICMPVCDPPPAYLREAVESVLAQVYPEWQLCIADDASRDAAVRAYLQELARDSRIALVTRTERGGIATATNDALSLATGEFVAFLDHDDVLAPHALYRFALAAADPGVGLIYSDEDKIRDDPDGRYDPYFKPDWSPETLLSKMYVGHLLAVRRTLVAQAGGMRPAFDGSQDYDLVLRVSELAERIVHVPDVLYHWRAHAGSAAAAPDAKPYAIDAAVAALSEALLRRGESGSVEMVDGRSGRYRVQFMPRRDEAIAIIIPTRDKAAVLARCLKSIFERSRYRRFAVLVIDNGSVEAATFALFRKWSAREPERFRVVRDARPFNYSALNNAAVRACDAPVLLFLNNDTQVLSPDWLEAMLGYAQRESIGAVGGLLLYPNGTVQHAGVVIGIGGLAGHIFKHFPGDASGYYDALKTVTNYSAVTAACLMVRREVFERVGGFDEALPVAWNDVDFCLRLRAAGYRNVYLPHVRLIHHESISRGLDTSPAKAARTAAEVARLRERWSVAKTTDPYYNPWLTLSREDASIAP